MSSGIHDRVNALLQATNVLGGYPGSLVCTEQGLLIASAGETIDHDSLGGLVALFDDIRARAESDLDLAPVDEFTLYVRQRWRLVVRPIVAEGATSRLFLVVLVPSSKTWRRHTNSLAKHLLEDLGPLLGLGGDDGA